MTLVSSPQDASFIRRRSYGSVVQDVGNGTDWLSFEAHVVRPEPGNTLVFFGGMQWEPNRLTALYLARELMPALRRICPSAELRLIGGPRIPQLQSCDGKHGVRVVGFVDDLPPAVRGCDVFVMPMFAGSGVKNKLAEAMAIGMPVVTNSLGAEALPEPVRDGMLVCDGHKATVHCIADLLVRAEERTILGQRAREVARQFFDWQAIRHQFITSLSATSAVLEVGSSAQQ
jgi:glycosyltransferase involved in cell wall biosynthesis